MRYEPRVRNLWLGLTLPLLACGTQAVDPAIVEDDGGVRIRRDVFTVPVPAPPPNPDGTATPPELNQVTVVRYRLDTAGKAPRPARAIILLEPGFLGGAGSFDALARAMVRRSDASGALEAWALDRRSNQLEDHAGLEDALDSGVADRVNDYYFDGGTVAGHAFTGFKQQSDVAFMSEWGLAATEADLRAVVRLVPEAERPRRVVLAGHSLGGQVAAQYAAWDFDGTPGYQELAGLVMIDAVTGTEGQPPVISREQYEDGGFVDPEGFGSVAGLADVRTTDRYFEVPFLSTTLYVVADSTALRARLHPDAQERDPVRGEALKTLLLVDRLPQLTNRAAFGLPFDVHSAPLPIAGVNAGEVVGPTEEYDSPFGTGKLVRPSDPSLLYTWKEYDQVDPKEFTSLTDFAWAWTRPGADFGEWYFPNRLNLDGFAAASLTLQPGDWPYDVYGLKASKGREIDVPVLAMAAGVLQHASAYDALKAILPPVGSGRPQAGVTRDTRDGFEGVEYPMLSHLDGLSGADDPGSPVRDWYDHLAAFAKRVTPPGGVVVP